MAHIAFIPYGIKRCVDQFLNDLSSQKHKLTLRKPGEEDKFIWIQGALRLMPGGVVEYVFPKEDMDRVLASLCKATTISDYGLDQPIKILGLKIHPLDYVRKYLRLEPIPENFNKAESYLWIMEHVSIIPLGIRHDKDMTEDRGEYIGWTHEAL